MFILVFNRQSASVLLLPVKFVWYRTWTSYLTGFGGARTALWQTGSGVGVDGRGVNIFASHYVCGLFSRVAFRCPFFFWVVSLFCFILVRVVESLNTESSSKLARRLSVYK